MWPGSKKRSNDVSWFERELADRAGKTPRIGHSLASNWGDLSVIEIFRRKLLTNSDLGICRDSEAVAEAAVLPGTYSIAQSESHRQLQLVSKH